jgi:hypothetical protein
MKRLRTAMLALALVVGGLALAACAPGANSAAGGQELAGFWLGLWREGDHPGDEGKGI